MSIAVRNITMNNSLKDKYSSTKKSSVSYQANVLEDVSRVVDHVNIDLGLLFLPLSRCTLIAKQQHRYFFWIITLTATPVAEAHHLYLVLCITKPPCIPCIQLTAFE